MSLRSLRKLTAALASLLLIVIGGMIPSAIINPLNPFSSELINLSLSWQVPILFLIGIVNGAEVGLVATTAYLILGLFYYPIFSGGGSIGYLATPNFGYLAGFLPAVWVVGRLVQRNKKNPILYLLKPVIVGLTIIHSIGIINLIIGTLFSRWESNLVELIVSYSIRTYPIHLLLSCPIILIARSVRKILMIE